MKPIGLVAIALLLALISGRIAVANTITPSEHFKIEDPIMTSPEEAEEMYSTILGRMKRGYALADYPAAKYYQQWQRYNKTPYLSVGHGNRYLNNYGNRAADNYLSLQPGQQMAEGAILAKDSFTAKKDGTLLPGALFLMEKLNAGKRPDYGDWRYIMILPDGALLGDSEGANRESMQFCHACHLAAETTDFLFLLPEE